MFIINRAFSYFSFEGVTKCTNPRYCIKQNGVGTFDLLHHFHSISGLLSGVRHRALDRFDTEAFLDERLHPTTQHDTSSLHIDHLHVPIPDPATEAKLGSQADDNTSHACASKEPGRHFLCCEIWNDNLSDWFHLV
jgi:hypothetical protein